MNFLTKHIVDSTARKVKYKAEVKFLDHVEKNRSVEGLVRKSTSKCNLIARQKKGIFSKNILTVTTEDGAKLYRISLNKLFSKICGAEIFDSNDGIIGHVEKEDDNWSTKGVMEKYHLMLHGEEIGVLNRKRSLKIDIYSDFNDWYMIGSNMHYDFMIYDSDENQLAKFSSSINIKNTGDEYVIQIEDSDNTEMVLLFFMVMLVITNA